MESNRPGPARPFPPSPLPKLCDSLCRCRKVLFENEHHARVLDIRFAPRSRFANSRRSKRERGTNLKTKMRAWCSLSNKTLRRLHRFFDLGDPPLRLARRSKTCDVYEDCDFDMLKTRAWYKYDVQNASVVLIFAQNFATSTQIVIIAIRNLCRCRKFWSCSRSGNQTCAGLVF